jgi:hypothetical protein
LSQLDASKSPLSRNNLFEASDKAFWQKAMDDQKQELVSLILKRRGVKLAAVGLGSADDATTKLFNGNAFTAPEAQKLGNEWLTKGLWTMWEPLKSSSQLNTLLTK